ncbi:hypothetical protein WL42_12680 [Burkholderia ubonensis]|nr:hypothetical protein WL42_12680 [Burkholderia ubonensis]
MLKPQDAVFTVGARTVKQDTNTYSDIPGVKVTLTKPNASFTVTIGTDADKTVDKLQKVVDAYNKLKDCLSKLTFSGNPTANPPQPPGPFSGDSSMRSLVDSFNSVLQQISGGQSLPSIGITVGRDGKLSLDKDRLKKAIDSNPAGIDKLLDNTNGIGSQLNKLLKSWTDSANGQIAKLRSTDQAEQKTANQKMADLKKKAGDMVEMYTKKFATLDAMFKQLQQLPNVLASLL